MSDSRVFFDSRDPACKTPTGTMKSGEALTLRLFLDRKTEIHAVRTVIRYDRHDQPAVYEMSLCGYEQRPSGLSGDLAPYEVCFTIEDRGLYWYYFEAETPDGVYRIGKSEIDDSATLQMEPSAWQQTVVRREYEEPDWICGGVYYHIFVDRFCHAGEYVYQEHKITRTDWGGMPNYLPENGKIYNRDFFGGNLAGIREKLPYLADLGVTCLYLSPIFEAYSNHKYDTGDYSKIDPMFGTEEDFTALCREAGERGIRIVLDGVFTHTGSDSVYFNKYRHYGNGGAFHDPDSPYRSWYSFREDGSYETWWGIRTLPRINKEDPSFREFICGEDGIVRRWLRKGASGWRLDVVDEFPCSFLEELVRAAKTEKPDALIIGEVWEDASNKIAYDERKNYFEGDKLDTVMDYPVKNALIDYVRYGSALSRAVQVERILEHYPPEDVRHALQRLFEVLDTPPDLREPYLEESLAAFPYVNGGLFAEMLPIAAFSAEMRKAILDCAALDWAKISPAIFGAMFQSVMDEKARHDLGAHYTSEQNILKLIRPLFLDALREEFEAIVGRTKDERQKTKDLGQGTRETSFVFRPLSSVQRHKLLAFHEKIASLTFLDPACGCGNFLLIAYRELRRLEMDVLEELH
ncbi:MAG: hypothetical protein IJH77_01505, partial [Mogibacterium sp.]|nr:hypothetical protein [Mogibacterium sp.]